jgi:hypothetical protein
MMLKAAIALIVPLVIANAAWAADSGVYLGASLGASDTPARCEEDLTRRCEGNLLGARAFLGYALNRQFGIEAGLNAIAASSDSNGSAIDLSAIASAPLSERVAFFGRLGVVGDGNHADLTYGAGLRFDLEEKASLRVEWLHYGSSNGVDFIFLGVLNRF